MHNYPGLGHPLRHNYANRKGHYPIGAHSACDGSISDLITVRELAMMDIMEKLTDKENWQKKVFDETIVAKWREEALAIPDDALVQLATESRGTFQYDEEKGIQGIVNEETFAIVIQELQSKARFFEKSGIIPVLDACATAAKSDTLVSKDLQEALRNAFDKLKSDQKASPDWHPNSNDMVQNLVHPSMYPLVYGRTRGFQEECVGVTDAIQHWSGKGNIIHNGELPAHDLGGIPEQFGSEKYHWLPANFDVQDGALPDHGLGGIPEEFWSEKYQWLPANIAFQDDGSVRFTSYINNLHPIQYPDIYRTIEKLVQTSLPLWDQCLLTGETFNNGTGETRTQLRVPRVDNPSDEEPRNWIPGDPEECADLEIGSADLEDAGYQGPYESDSEDDAYLQLTDEDREELTEYKWKVVRRPKIPPAEFSDVKYTVNEAERLAQRFKESGLQVIVKMASIELTPENPEFKMGKWHVEGQMNEHICATALYYLDSENITDSSISFRMQTGSDLWSDDEYFMVEQDAYHWMEHMYAANLGADSTPALVNYGTVATRQGRLLAFPNGFQHRVSSFKLADPTKPGHRRFIALWLVKPTMRIISTANVPPQQMSWYVDSLLGSNSSARTEALSKLPPDLVNLLGDKGLSGVEANENGKLPAELMEMVREFFNADREALPMSLDEAKTHRLDLMAERSVFQKNGQNEWLSNGYNFCEH